ncbi:MAG: hypothetical protein ACRCR9_00105 [Chitinophagaceae bacterium]
MRKTNRTSGIIRSSYKRDEPMWWLIVQIVGALAVIAMLLAIIINYGL